jgi:hypothetical protein
MLLAPAVSIGKLRSSVVTGTVSSRAIHGTGCPPISRSTATPADAPSPTATPPRSTSSRRQPRIPPRGFAEDSAVLTPPISTVRPSPAQPTRNQQLTSNQQLALRLRPRRLVLRVAQRHLQVHLLASAKHRHRHRIARVFRSSSRPTGPAGCNLLPIETHNQVAAQHHRRVALVRALVPAVQSRLLCRAARQHPLDQHAVVRGQPNLLAPCPARSAASRCPASAAAPAHTSQSRPAPPSPY